MSLLPVAGLAVAPDFWAKLEAIGAAVTGLFTTVLVGVAWRGLTQLRLTKKDMLTRAQRDSISCAIHRCEEYASEILGKNGDILVEIAKHKVPVFVKSPAEIQFDPDNAADVQRAWGWIKALPPGLYSQMVVFLNRLEAWAMYFTHRLADSSVAFGPVAPAFCSNVVQLYAVLLVTRTFENSGKYPNIVALYQSWMSVKEVEQRQLKLDEILRALDKVQREGPRVRGHHTPPLGTELDA